MKKVTKKDRIVDRFKLSIEGTKYVLGKPKYAVLAVVLAFLLASIIYFSINSGYYGALLLSPLLNIVDKLSVLGILISQMTQEFFTTVPGFVLLLVGLLQGAAFSVMIYNMRRNKRMDMGNLGKSGVAMVAATLGLGCVPCGTSLLIPLLTLILSSSSAAYAAADFASIIILFLAFILSAYSLYRLGYIAVAHKAVDEVSESKASKSKE